MEAWLLFPIRMVAILLLAFVVYLVCDDVQQRLVVDGSSRPKTADHDIDKVLSPPPKRVSPIPLTVGLGTFITVLFCVERTSIRQFQNAINQVLAQGGSIRFDPPYESTLSRYYATIATVDLSDAPVDDTDILTLHSIPNLKSIRFANTNIGGRTIGRLSKCHGLERVDLSQTHICDEDLDSLHQIRRLRSLILNDTPITDAAVPHLSLCRTLEKLELQGTGVTDDGHRKLLAALPNATHVPASVAT